MLPHSHRNHCPAFFIFGCCASAAEAHEFLATVPLPKAPRTSADVTVSRYSFAVCKSCQDTWVGSTVVLWCLRHFAVRFRT